MALNQSHIALLESIPISTNIPGMTLASLIVCKSPFYVPVCEETLQSEFCTGVTWGKLIGHGLRTEFVCKLGDINFVPIFINPQVKESGKISLKISYLLEPAVIRTINLQQTNHTKETKIADTANSNGKSRKNRKKSTPKKFYFNGREYDFLKLKKGIHSMNINDLSLLKKDIASSLRLLLEVDYIVTDTNNWCNVSDDNQSLRYEELLSWIAKYIAAKKLPAKFLVLSEVLMELKRLSKDKWSARRGQSLLCDSFMPRNIVYIPNSDDNISYNVIADGFIQSYVVKLFKEGKRLSVVTNDQQALMLFHAAVDNQNLSGKYSPNFLSLENINQLYEIIKLITQHLKQKNL